MNWFEKHLNWTYVLALLASYPVAFIIGFIFGLLFLDESTSYSTIEGLSYVIYFFIFVALLILAGWVITRKRRNMLWILLLFIPLGIIPFLMLENMSESTQNNNILPYKCFNYKMTTCPRCGSNNINDSVFKRAENENQKHEMGCNYLWEGLCLDCRHKWYWREQLNVVEIEDIVVIDKSNEPSSYHGNNIVNADINNFCHVCGKELKTEMAFCPNCGRKIS